MPSKVTKKGIAASDLAIDGKSIQTSETAHVNQPGVDVIPTGASKSGRGKRKRNIKDGVEGSIDQETPEKPKRNKKVKIQAEAEVISPSGGTSKKVKRGAEIEVKEEVAIGNSEDLKDTLTTPIKAKKKTKTKIKKESVDIDGEEGKVHTEEAPDTPKKVKRKRKTKEEKDAEAMPIAARTTGLRMFVGAHVSGAKGRSQRSILDAMVYIASIEAEENAYTRCPQLHNQLRSHRVILPPLPFVVCQLIDL